MTTFDRHTATMYVGETIVSPKEARITLDRGWAPFVQGTIRVPMSLGFDPRNDDRVRIELLQVFGESMLASEVSAAHPGALASAMSALWAGMTAAEVSELHFTPWNSFGARSSTKRSLDLAVIGVSTDLRARETTITVASDEALAQGHILVQTIPITYGTTSVRSIVSQVLGRMGAVLQAGTADADLDEVPTWEPGTSAWAFLAPLVQQAGLRLWCDGHRSWTLDVDEADPVGDLALSSAETIADATLAVDIDRGGRADAVVIRYQWRDSLGVDRIKYDVAGKNNPRMGVFIDYEDTVYPGPGAAAEVLRRRQNRGHDAPIEAVSDYTAEPGQALTLTFMGDGFTREGIVQAVEWRFPAAKMSVTPAALVEGPPPPTPDTTPPTPGTIAGSNITETGFDLTISGASDETALHAQPYAFSTDNGATWTAYQSSNVRAVSGLTASTGYTCKGRVRDAEGNTADTPPQVVTTSSPPPLAATFRQAAVDAVDRTTYTFAAQPIGPASATRRVVVAVGSRTATISSVTIGGVAATLDVNFTASNNRVAIASAVVPTGTTADVIVTFTGTVGRCGIGVWTLNNAAAPTGQTGTGSGVSPAASVTTAAGEVVITAAYENGTGGSTATWTGATERYDGTVETDMTHTGADTTASGGTTNVSVAWSATSGSVIAAAAYA